RSPFPPHQTITTPSASTPTRAQTTGYSSPTANPDADKSLAGLRSLATGRRHLNGVLCVRRSPAAGGQCPDRDVWAAHIHCLPTRVHSVASGVLGRDGDS